MAPSELKVDVDYDEDWNGIFVFTCGQCGVEHRKSFCESTPGTAILCPCGVEFIINDDALQSAQKGLDDIKNALNNF